MRVDLNLATRPYRDVGRFLSRWVPWTVFFVVASCVLLWYAQYSRRQSADINRQITELQAQVSQLDRDKAHAMQVLNLPENKSVTDQSRFVNQLIYRKAFSWTRVFMQLEEIMPPGLHVISLAPQLGADSQLELKITVGGSSRERAIELVRRLEQSPSFRHARLISETMAEGNGSAQSPVDPVQFQIEAAYSIERASGVTTTEKSANSSTTTAEVR